MKNRFLAIVDIEATCWMDKRVPLQKYHSEIIEIGALLVSLDKSNYLNIVKRFDVFIKPVIHPKLSEFCKKLTSIKQEDVDKGMKFSEAMNLFKSEVFSSMEDTIFGSWGEYDFNKIGEECTKRELDLPYKKDKTINLKPLVASIKGWKKRGLSIGRSLKALNMEFEGTPHRGIDDVINIRRILLKVGNNLKL